jgi:hypothetical protein
MRKPIKIISKVKKTKGIPVGSKIVAPKVTPTVAKIPATKSLLAPEVPYDDESGYVRDTESDEEIVSISKGIAPADKDKIIRWAKNELQVDLELQKIRQTIILHTGEDPYDPDDDSTNEEINCKLKQLIKDLESDFDPEKKN